MRLLDAFLHLKQKLYVIQCFIHHCAQFGLSCLKLQNNPNLTSGSILLGLSSKLYLQLDFFSQQKKIYDTHLPPHFAGSNRKASKSRFWHEDSAMSMYLEGCRPHGFMPELTKYSKSKIRNEHCEYVENITEISIKNWWEGGGILISSIESSTRISSTVFVGHDRPNNLHHRDRSEVLRRYESESLCINTRKFTNKKITTSSKFQLKDP